MRHQWTSLCLLALTDLRLSGLEMERLWPVRGMVVLAVPCDPCDLVACAPPSWMSSLSSPSKFPAYDTTIMTMHAATAPMVASAIVSRVRRIGARQPFRSALKMLPLAILAGLIGVGMYISRNEVASTLEAPVPQKCDKSGAPYVPKRASPTSKAERAEAPAAAHGGAVKAGPGPRAPGPRGEGLVAHFSDSQVGNIKQPPGILERNGASPSVHVPKREIPNMASVQADRLPAADIDRSRYSASTRKDGTSPFNPQRPRGEDTDALHMAAQGQSVDELRSAANPKLSAEGRMAAPPMLGSMRGEQGQLQIQSKRNQCDDTTFSPGMSAVKRGTGPGEYLLPRSSCRDGAEQPLPGAGRAWGARSTVDPTLRFSNSTLVTPVGGVAGGERARDRERDLDMFDSMCEPERGDLAAMPLGNAGSSAMGVRGVPPPKEGFAHERPARANRRAIASKNARLYGPLQIVNPPKQTTYEPGDPMRTTLKETTIHDQGDGWLRGPEATTARDPDAIARVTGRETLRDVQGAQGDDGRLSGTSAVYKPPVYDPNDLFKTTTRETTERNTHTGNVGTLADQGSGVEQPELDQTQRALTQVSYFGDAAKPTADGYRVVSLNNPGTNRMIAPTTDYRGSAAPRIPKTPSSKGVYTRVIGDARERVLRSRSPRGRRETLPAGKESFQASRRPRIDPCMDFQQQRASFQNQGRVQSHVVPECVGETRGGRRVIDSRPDPALLAQLESNPYVLKS